MTTFLFSNFFHFRLTNWSRTSSYKKLLFDIINNSKWPTNWDRMNFRLSKQHSTCSTKMATEQSRQRWDSLFNLNHFFSKIFLLSNKRECQNLTLNAFCLFCFFCKILRDSNPKPTTLLHVYKIGNKFNYILSQGFRLTKRDDYFGVIFDHFWSIVIF